jgi:hypothetical protein
VIDITNLVNCAKIVNLVDNFCVSIGCPPAEQWTQPHAHTHTHTRTHAHTHGVANQWSLALEAETYHQQRDVPPTERK